MDQRFGNFYSPTRQRFATSSQLFRESVNQCDLCFNSHGHAIGWFFLTFPQTALLAGQAIGNSSRIGGFCEGMWGDEVRLLILLIP